MKKIIVIAVCAVLMLSLVSCSMVSVNEDKDGKQVVAKVGDVSLSKGDFLKYLDMALMNNNLDRETFYTLDQASIDSFEQQVLTGFLNEEMLYQEAVKKGFLDDSQENKDKLKADVEAYFQTIKDSIKASIDPAITDAEKIKEETDKAFQDLIKQSGFESYEELLVSEVDNQVRADAVRAVYDEITKNVTFSEDDAKAFYDTEVKNQSETMEKNPESIAVYSQLGQSYVRPEEARYVKHILTSIPEEKQTEINALKQEGKEQEAVTMQKEELAKIKSVADGALKRAQAGEDFDALVAELGKDPGMQAEPAKTEGYLVYTDSGMVKPFETASLALAKIGDISPLVESDFGYHIIKYIADGGGPIPFEEVKDSIVSTKLSELQNQELTKGIEEIKTNYKIETFENVLKK